MNFKIMALVHAAFQGSKGNLPPNLLNDGIEVWHDVLQLSLCLTPSPRLPQSTGMAVEATYCGIPKGKPKIRSDRITRLMI